MNNLNQSQDEHRDASDDHSTGTNILSLNDDCLLAIFDFMDITDQIQAARVCKRFENVFKEKNQHKFKTFDFMALKSLEPCQQKELLRLIGDRVESVLISGSQEMLKYVADHCVNLKKMKLSLLRVTAENISSFIKNGSNIREFHFIDVGVDDDLTEKLKYFQSLEVLSINSSVKVSGKYFNELVELKELHLINCFRLNANYIIGAIGKMKNLRVLEIDHHVAGGAAVGQIIRSAPNLEELHMSTVDKEIDFSHIKCLKNFSIREISDSAANSKLFENLALAHSKNLQTLRIFGQGIVYLETDQMIRFEWFKKFILSKSICDDIGIFQNLEALTLEHCVGLDKSNLMNLLTECHKLQHLRLLYTIKLSEDIIKSISALLVEQREHGVRTHKLRIYENLPEYFDCEYIIKKHVSPELEVSLHEKDCICYCLKAYSFVDESDFDVKDDDFSIYSKY